MLLRNSETSYAAQNDSTRPQFVATLSNSASIHSKNDFLSWERGRESVSGERRLGSFGEVAYRKITFVPLFFPRWDESSGLSRLIECRSCRATRECWIGPRTPSPSPLISVIVSRSISLATRLLLRGFVAVYSYSTHIVSPASLSLNPLSSARPDIFWEAVDRFSVLSAASEPLDRISCVVHSL